MNASTVVRIALINLRRVPARSLLTTLGIVVGVAAVVATASIGNGAKSRIQETLTKPEMRTIYLGASVPHRLTATLPRRDSLKPDDYYAIRDTVQNISAVSPRIYLANIRASANGHAADAIVEGVDVAGFITEPHQVLQGTLFSGLDVKRATNVCVISESLAGLLFPKAGAAGQSMRLNGNAFRIVGVVEDDSRFSLQQPADLHVYVPFTSLLRRLNESAQFTLSAQASDVEHVRAVQEGINDIMEQRRSGRKAVFRTANAFESLKAYTDGSLTVARLLAAVAAIALVVGGIGIMNVMMISVTERTREIGVRLALGTRSSDILGQFLVEAIAISALGGAIGVVIGWVIALMITRLNHWPTEVTIGSVLISLICSVSVGLFFGYHPARRAALLRPVDALRTEH